MTGHAVTVRRTVQASVERVWAVLTDLDRAAEHISAITDVEILTDGPYALGTTWLQTRRVFGRSATAQLCVVDNDPLRRTVIETSAGTENETLSSATLHRTVFVLAPMGESGTELSVQLDTEATDPRGTRQLARAAVGQLVLKATQRALRRDLDDIAAAAAGPYPDSAA